MHRKLIIAPATTMQDQTKIVRIMAHLRVGLDPDPAGQHSLAHVFSFQVVEVDSQDLGAVRKFEL